MNINDPVEQADAPPDAVTPVASESATPRLLASRYLLEERVADGGMASVWRAHDEVLARTVAIKLLHAHLAADPSFRERFRREAIAAAKLTHPNIVSLYDTGAEGDRVYLVLEYVDGVTLKDVITDLGVLDVDQAAGIAVQVARALDYAHTRGLVHRDVKPANILIGADGGVKVTDFGIAKVLEQASDLTKTGMVLGTAAYVAPEQILSKPLDGRADQYALGCVLYETLTGRKPFHGDSSIATAAARLEQDPLPPRAVRADIPRSLDAVVMRALARDPAERFPSAGALADALGPFADTDPDHTASLLRADEPTEAVWTEAEAEAAAPTTTSFLRTEGRWLAPVLALVLLAAALIGVGLATGVLAPDGAGFLPIRIASDEERAARSVEEESDGRGLAAVTAIAAFDPQGTDGVENDGDLPNLLDGDPDTTWRTDLYNTAAFGNLKDGVGFWVDLGEPHQVSLVALRTTTPGISYEVRVADQPGTDPGAWELLGEVSDAPELAEVRAAEPRTARYLLVWVTGDLQPRSGRFTAEFADLAVRGEAG